MFDSGFIWVEYIFTFTVAGWTVLRGPVAVFLTLPEKSSSLIVYICHLQQELDSCDKEGCVIHASHTLLFWQYGGSVQVICTCVLPVFYVKPTSTKQYLQYLTRFCYHPKFDYGRCFTPLEPK